MAYFIDNDFNDLIIKIVADNFRLIHLAQNGTDMQYIVSKIKDNK